MVKRLEKMGTADRQVVIEGVEVLREAFEKFLNDKQRQGHGVTSVNGFMIAHNFHKLIIFDLAEKMELPKEGQDLLMKVAIDTMTQAMNKPVTNETDPAVS